MFKKKILKISRSILKKILPVISLLLIKLRLNRRVINFLSEQSNKANDYYDFSNILSDLNGEDKIISLDVGAQGGFNSEEVFSSRYNNYFEPIMIEPIKEEAEKLKSKFRFVLDKGLWSSQSKKKINILGNRLGSSSFYEPNKSSLKIHSIKEKEISNFNITEKREINCETIDFSLEKIGIKKLDYLKIDTQGAEFEILKGMKKYKPLLIRLEVHIFSMYKNVPNWSNLIKLLDELNYMVIDWKEIGSHVTRTPAETDMVFIPNFTNETGKQIIKDNKKNLLV